MTVRDCYEACLIELNKVQAPSLLLNDFVYLLNKNIQEYFNKKYNSFEKIQQNTDDLRSLINWINIEITESDYNEQKNLYSCKLPMDYVHILGCTATFKNESSKSKRCGGYKGVYETIGVNKLDSSQHPQVGTNWYMKPSYKRPYYQIINIEQDNIEPDSQSVENDNPTEPRIPGKRYGNSTVPIMQILCGNEDNIKLESIEIQYLQAPKYVNITVDQLDQVDDYSPVLEFSDYVCNEIVKQLVTQILENQKDQRLQTYIPVNQSIPQN